MRILLFETTIKYRVKIIYAAWWPPKIRYIFCFEKNRGWLY
jgi:hypothetical protein